MTQRVALSIGVAADSPAGEEAHPDAIEALPEVPRRVDALAEALRHLGYACTAMAGAHTAAEIGEAVRTASQSLGPDDTLVVHVYSHGITRNGTLYLVGADGRHHDDSNVEAWLRRVDDHDPPKAPRTLFLLDVCHAGLAARLHWQAAQSDDRTRAWVIAACGPREAAFEGRFTDAVAHVLGELADGRLDLDQSVRFASLETIAREIRREVSRRVGQAGALHQRVTANRVDISSPPLDLPFFENRAFTDAQGRRARARVDAAVLPFLEDVDEALDAGHFLSRAAGYGVLATDRLTGCFSGRSRELKRLSPWVNLQGGGGLCIVTGGPGAGKSALIGLLVCAAHPELREPTRPVWERAEQAPYPNRQMAAISARERSLAQVVASLARQLHLLPDVQDPSAADVISAVSAMPEVPVVIIDGLDEAPDKLAIMEQLLLPLSRVSRPDRNPVRILVGTRPLPEFEPLFTAAATADTGWVLDLDDVEPRRLRDDVSGYVYNLLLADRRWDELPYVGTAQVLARAVAEALTVDTANREWGAFLVAGLFTGYVLSTFPEPIADQPTAIRLGKDVPRTLPDLLELDLRTRATSPWVAPVLSALAHAKGDGMPVRILAHVAAALANRPVPEHDEILGVLDTVRFYLRNSPEVDGTTLYRLFHQGLADHLQQVSDADAVLDGLLAAVRVGTDDAGADRQWELAEPYLLRHAGAHAALANRLDEVLTDLGYLLVADSGALLDQADSLGAGTEGTAGQELLEIVRAATAASSTEGDVAHRRRSIALAAVRRGRADLAARLFDLPGVADAWQPLWADSTSSAVTAVATGSYDGEAIAVLGTAAGSLIWRDLRSGRLLASEPCVHRQEVTAICVDDEGPRGAVVSGDVSGTLLRHLSTEPHPHVVLQGAARPELLAPARLAGRRSVISVTSSGAGEVWDLELRLRAATMTLPMEVAESFRVSGRERRIVRLADAPHEAVVIEGSSDRLPLRHEAPVLSAAAGALDDMLLLFTGDQGGVVRAWDGRGALIDEIELAAPIRGLHATGSGDLLVRAGDEIIAFHLAVPVTSPVPGGEVRLRTLPPAAPPSIYEPAGPHPQEESLRWGRGRAVTEDGPTAPPQPDEQKGHSLLTLIPVNRSEAGKTEPGFVVASAYRSDAGHHRKKDVNAVFVGSSVFAVADGQDDRPHPDVASATVAAALGALDQQSAIDPLQALYAGIKRAIANLNRAIGEDDGRKGMAATVGAVVLAGSRIGVVQLGDVRVYRARRDQPLTQFPTHETEKLAAFLADPEFAYRNHMRGVPARVLDGRDIGPVVSVHGAQVGDRYLICSKGVWAQATHEDLAAALSGADTRETAANRLIALAQGEKATVLVLDLVRKKGKLTALLRGASDRPGAAGSSA
ncbi:protein phosphatase 2C domain-containing protein [Micromonospora sp. NPDC049836]|uniref:protein phosphatase 2C domain-containing protein n=1 Tax=Micromonospora sp. NPDC049836 TaxID=3364274 RepID=UPI003798DFAD